MIARSGSATVLLLLFAALPLWAVRNDEARITQVFHDVKLLARDVAPRPASLNDKVTDGLAVRTGGNSRAELRFPDLTLTRIGANSLFRFNQAGREVEMDNGAILLEVPKNSGGARIRSDIITVGITGTTVLFEARPRDYSKLIVLEGFARASLRSRLAEAATVHAGQMLVVRSGATRLPAPVEIDLDRIVKTATLITGFPALPSLNLIVAAIDNQRRSGLQLATPDVTSDGLDARDVAAAVRSTPSPPSLKPGKPPRTAPKP